MKNLTGRNVEEELPTSEESRKERPLKDWERKDELQSYTRQSHNSSEHRRAARLPYVVYMKDVNCNVLSRHGDPSGAHNLLRGFSPYWKLP